MNVSFESIDKVSGKLILKVEAADYEPELDKQLKEYRKRANVPGFRKGMVPIGMIRRMYGNLAKAEVVDRIVNGKISEYVEQNKLRMLGHALADEATQNIDLTKEAPYTFTFELGFAPEISITLGEGDTLPRYIIDVDDKMVDDQVEALRTRAGKYVQVEEYDETTNDLLKGELLETAADGTPVEGGIKVEDASIMPQYIEDSQKQLFKGAKVGSAVRFSPKKAYPERQSEIASLLNIEKEDVADVENDFTLTIKTISRYEKAAIDQELFDKVFGEGKVKDEKEFRQKVAEGIKSQLVPQEDYRFMLDMREYALRKAGDIELPKTQLRKIMEEDKKDGNKLTDVEFDSSLSELRWYLVRAELVKAFGIKVSADDINAIASKEIRAMFAQYGMTEVPDDVIANAVERRLKEKGEAERYFERALDEKLGQTVKEKVKFEEKTVSMEEFNKLFEKPGKTEEK